MTEGCRDFMSGLPIDLQIYNSDSIEIHHIVLRAYCKSQGISGSLYNSIVNKLPFSAMTNRSIGGNALILNKLRKETFFPFLQY